MAAIRAAGIPLPVTLFAMLMAVAGTALGLIGLFDPSGVNNYVDGADSLATTWGGRNAGLGLAAGAAVLLRSAPAYVVAFVGSTLREISDMVDLLAVQPETSIGAVIPIALFLVFDLIALAFSWRAFRSHATPALSPA